MTNTTKPTKQSTNDLGISWFGVSVLIVVIGFVLGVAAVVSSNQDHPPYDTDPLYGFWSALFGGCLGALLAFLLVTVIAVPIWIWRESGRVVEAAQKAAMRERIRREHAYGTARWDFIDGTAHDIPAQP